MQIEVLCQNIYELFRLELEDCKCLYLEPKESYHSNSNPPMYVLRGRVTVKLCSEANTCLQTLISKMLNK